MTFKDPAAEWPRRPAPRVRRRPRRADDRRAASAPRCCAASAPGPRRSSTCRCSASGCGAIAPEVTSAKLYENVEIPTFDRDSLPEPARRHLPDEGRPVHHPRAAPGRPVLARPLRAPRASRSPRRPALQGRRRPLREPARVHPGAARRLPHADVRRVVRPPPDPARSVGAAPDRARGARRSPGRSRTATSSRSPRRAARSSCCPRTRCSSTRPRPRSGGAPEHGEHTDEVLLELGLTYDEIIEHKVTGAVL